MSRKRAVWRLAVIVALLAIVVAGIAVWKCYEHDLSRRPPDVDLAHADPAVVKAITAARRAVESQPRSGKAWGELGLTLNAHQYDLEANVCFAEASRLDPREATWPYLRAVSLSVRDPAAAEECFRDMIKSQPNLVLPKVRLAEMYLRQRRLDEASQLYEDARRLEPDNARVLLGQAMIAQATGDLASARALGEESLRLDPKPRSTCELLIKVSHQLGDAQSVDRYRRLLAGMPPGDVGWIDPYVDRAVQMRRDPGGIASAATDFAAAGRFREAAELFEKLVVMSPENPQWYVLGGRSLVRMGNLERAAQILDDGLRRHPDSAELHFQRGGVLFFQKEWAAARDQFLDAVRLKPDYSDAYYNLGHARRQLQEREGAIEAFQAAIRFRPDYAAAYVNLGELLREAGRMDEAHQALETAKRLQRNVP